MACNVPNKKKFPDLHWCIKNTSRKLWPQVDIWCTKIPTRAKRSERIYLRNKINVCVLWLAASQILLPFDVPGSLFSFLAPKAMGLSGTGWSRSGSKLTKSSLCNLSIFCFVISLIPLAFEVFSSPSLGVQCLGQDSNSLETILAYC